jgi:hypothetical protein
MTQSAAFWSSNADFNRPQVLLPVATIDLQLFASSETDENNWNKHDEPPCQTFADMLLERLHRGEYAQVLRETVRTLSVYSEVLAETFERKFEDVDSAAVLIQELRDMGRISDEEYNRLTVLVIVLNSIEYELSGHGGKPDSNLVEYLQEYCQLVEKILSRNGFGVYVGENVVGANAQDQLANRVETVVREYVTEADGRSASNSQELL